MFRTIALTGFAALVARRDHLVCAPGRMRRSANIFFPIRRHVRPGSIPARQSTTAAATAARRRRGSAGTAAGPPVADPQPSAAARAGCAGTGQRAVAAAGAAAGTTVVPQNTPAGIAVAPPQPQSGRRGRAAGRQSPARRTGTASAAQKCAADAGDACSPATRWSPSRQRRRRQQEGELFGPRQDHRAHHQFRRRCRRDRSVRCASCEDRRLLYAPRPRRPPTPTRLSRSTRSRCRARVKRIFFGLDVCGQSRPCMASSIRFTTSG